MKGRLRNSSERTRLEHVAALVPVAIGEGHPDSVDVHVPSGRIALGKRDQRRLSDVDDYDASDQDFLLLQRIRRGRWSRADDRPCLRAAGQELVRRPGSGTCAMRHSVA